MKTNIACIATPLQHLSWRDGVVWRREVRPPATACMYEQAEYVTAVLDRKANSWRYVVLISRRGKDY